MFAWVKSFFGSADRVTVAGERAAKAAEDIADMFEQQRDQLRARLGIEAPAAPVVVKPIEAPAETKTEPVAETGKKGRSRG